MEYRHKYMRYHMLTRKECCSLSFAIENCHIFFEGQCENTFRMSAADATEQKYGIIFILNSTQVKIHTNFYKNIFSCKNRNP